LLIITTGGDERTNERTDKNERTNEKTDRQKTSKTKFVRPPARTSARPPASRSYNKQ